MLVPPILFEGGYIMATWHYTPDNVAYYTTEKALHIRTDEALEGYLAQPGNQALALAEQLLDAYLAERETPLAITPDSLAIEILAHVYVDSFAEAVESFSERISGDEENPLARLMEKIQTRTDVIDCGEADVDGNRKIWDMLVPMRSAIYLLCGQR